VEISVLSSGSSSRKPPLPASSYHDDRGTPRHRRRKKATAEMKKMTLAHGRLTTSNLSPTAFDSLAMMPAAKPAWRRAREAGPEKQGLHALCKRG
jgi:hypothetical protein